MERVMTTATPYHLLQERLRRAPRTWLVTGAAGFIGSHLLETLLKLEQRVVGLDNFATGHRHNLDEVQRAVGEAAWSRFRFIEGDISDLATCREALAGVDAVLHQAAFVSVPGSIEDPLLNHQRNVTGFLNLLVAAQERGLKRFVYASSSAVYGDAETLPAREEAVGNALSPYAASKAMDELYAGVFTRLHGLEAIGLRYFNIFGPRQDPNGAYAAVIPKWTARLLSGQRGVIFGDGSATRDFCFVGNVVQANVLAATTENPAAFGGVFNVGNGGATTTRALYETLRDRLAEVTGREDLRRLEPRFDPPRPGDIAHSRADIGRAQRLLGFEPDVSVEEGLRRTLAWYAARAQTPAR
jgi:UDP-N-acetylglucosamine 4-epimerase